MTKRPTKLKAVEVTEILTALKTSNTQFLEQAFRSNRFIDSRLTNHYLKALANVDNYRHDEALIELLTEKIIPAYGTKVVKEIEKAFKLKGDVPNGQRLKILHRINSEKAKPLVLKAAEKGSYTVKISAIQCLGDYTESFDLLHKFSQQEDFEWTAELAIARLGTPESQAFLIQKLEDEDYTLLFHCNDKKVLALALKKAEECFEQLKKEKSNAKRKSLRENFGCLAKICQSNSLRYNRLVLACLDHLKCFEKRVPEYGAGVLGDILETIGLGKKANALKLLEVRDQIPPGYFGIVADVGRKHLKFSEFFDTFSKYANPNAKSKSTDGIRDGELFESLSRELGSLWSFDEFRAGKKEKAKLDPRWAGLAFKVKDDGLILELAHLAHPKLSAYLSKKLKENMKKDPFDQFPILEAMVRSKHADAAEATLSLISKKALRKKYDPDYQRWLYLLKDLPKSVKDEVRKLPAHPKCNEEAADQIPQWLALAFKDYFTPAAINFC